MAHARPRPQVFQLPYLSETRYPHLRSAGQHWLCRALVVPCRFNRLIRPQRPVFRRAPTVPGRATPGTELTSTTYRLTGHAGCWHKTSVASRTARSLPHRPALRDQVCVRWSATLIAPGVAGGDPRAQGLIAEPRPARRSAGSQPFRSRGLVSSGCSKGAGTIRP